ncbi:MAG: hypothetical protein H8E60_05545 [Candidatus Marinimicrobia bacterium]|nr:hypothetical protein [Candidatus Neomarinimicrobiota bacterium]
MASISWNLIVIDQTPPECDITSGLPQGSNFGSENSVDPNWEESWQWTYSSNVAGGTCTSPQTFTLDIDDIACQIEVFDAQCSFGNPFVFLNSTYTPPLLGCMDDTACNYDDTATADDESCEYANGYFTCGCYNYQQGDFNLDCQTNILDVVNMVEMVIHETPFTEQELMICDMNNDNIINVVDLVMLVSFIIGALFK